MAGLVAEASSRIRGIAESAVFRWAEALQQVTFEQDFLTRFAGAVSRE
jgi:hypothetical protein